MKNKKYIAPFFMALLFLWAADVQAADTCSIDTKCFYAKILSGANFLQSSTINENRCAYQTGYMIAGSLGYFCYYGLHVEAEYAYRRNGIKKIYFFGQGSSENGHFQNSSFMANLLWDLPLCSWGCRFRNIRPFIGAGIGCDLQEMDASNSRIIFQQKWTHFSWQAMTGFVFPIFRSGEMTLEYKFHQGGSHFNNQSIAVGLLYKFGYLK